MVVPGKTSSCTTGGAEVMERYEERRDGISFRRSTARWNAVPTLAVLLILGSTIPQELSMAAKAAGATGPPQDSLRESSRSDTIVEHSARDPTLNTCEETSVRQRLAPFRAPRRAEGRRSVKHSSSRLRVEALEARALMSGMSDGEMMMHPEHMAAMKLVPSDQADHVATSGNWSEIWGQDAPTSGDEVLIPKGVTVTVDGQFDAELDWIRVDGTLKFATDRDTALRVETIVVTPTGHLQIGTADQPIDPRFHAQVTFVDSGPIDRTVDPLGVSRGLVDLSGHLSIYGAETTSFVDLAQYPRPGDTVLQLAEVPTNWQVGGHLVLPGTNPGPRSKFEPAANQDEELTITAIQGTRVTVDHALLYNHDLPDNVPLPVAYLDRNVVLTSENTTDPARRGHVMVMGMAMGMDRRSSRSLPTPNSRVSAGRGPTWP